MKYAICIPTYKRPELLPITVESILKDPTNPSLPIFVSSDSSPEYRTKEIEHLKTLCNQGPSKIYYIDTERSEPYKRQLQKLSGLNGEVIDIAMNGGSAGANRNRLLLLACTYGADGVIFLDDDMKVEEGFIEYHNIALGNTVSQFLSKMKNYKGTKGKKFVINGLKRGSLEKNIEVFGSNWDLEDQREHDYPLPYDDFIELGETATLDAGNLSLTNLVYNTIPFPTHSQDEDWNFGLCAIRMLEVLDGIIIMSTHPTSYQKELGPNPSERQKRLFKLESDIRSKCGDISYSKLHYIWWNVKKILPTSLGKNYGREMMKRMGEEVQNFVKSSELEEMLPKLEKELESRIKEYNFEDSFNAKDITEKLRKDLWGTGILYQNWTNLTDAAKKIDSSILDEFLITE